MKVDSDILKRLLDWGSTGGEGRDPDPLELAKKLEDLSKEIRELISQQVAKVPNYINSLPLGVLLRCLLDAGVWRVDDLDPVAITTMEAPMGRKVCMACGGRGFDIDPASAAIIGPWFVSRGWRDIFWLGPDSEGCLLEVMSRFHGSERLTLDRVMVRAGSGPSRLLPNPGRLADKAFLNAYSDNIQTVSTVSYWNSDDIPHELTELGALWVPSNDRLIRGIRVKCTWRDQGWGNMKGRLHIAIKRRREAAHEDEHLSDQEDHASDSVWSESDSEDYEGGVLPALISFPNSGTSSTWACVKGTMVDLFRRNADHTLRNESVFLDASNEMFNTHIIQRQLPGDRLVVMYIVGGGGGHSLHITDLSIYIAHSNEAAVAVKNLV